MAIRPKISLDMNQILSNLDFETNGKGFLDITKEINTWIENQKFTKGILLIFLKHTSCSLIINENADINVLKDLSNYMKAIVPEKRFSPLDGSNKKIEYQHSEEGLDDMPAHIRTMLTSNNLSFSVDDGKLGIGLWQAIYIWEHRASNKSRSLRLHAIGDFELDLN
tara:strand:+ start:476 stop:973 length:498 start_codon:yes stop_codon:yes gene_type:complete